MTIHLNNKEQVCKTGPVRGEYLRKREVKGKFKRWYT
jgi:hypothetical protein